MLFLTTSLIALLCIDVLGSESYAAPYSSRRTLRHPVGHIRARSAQWTEVSSDRNWEGAINGESVGDGAGLATNDDGTKANGSSTIQVDSAWRLTVSVSIRSQVQRLRAQPGSESSTTTRTSTRITAAAWAQRKNQLDGGFLFQSNTYKDQAHLRVRLRRRPKLPLNKFTIDLPQALSFAQLQSTVYCNIPDILRWNCTRCGDDGVTEFQQHKVHFDPDWDVLGMTGFWPKWNAIFVVFRGTDSTNLGNWIHDMNVLKTAYYQLPYPGYENAQVHHGFFYCFNASTLATQINDSLAQLLAAHPNVPVYFMGHSLGAAMATIAAPYMKVVHNLQDVRLWTFGSPRTGNLMFATLVASIVDESVRFTHSHDIVPSLPLPLFGYHHVAREVWQLPPQGHDAHVELRICDRSGEDPRCHRSACILGLCRSIVDHVFYLGKHMYHNEDEC